LEGDAEKDPKETGTFDLDFRRRRGKLFQEGREWKKDIGRKRLEVLRGTSSTTEKEGDRKGTRKENMSDEGNGQEKN